MEDLRDRLYQAYSKMPDSSLEQMETSFEKFQNIEEGVVYRKILLRKTLPLIAASFLVFFGILSGWHWWQKKEFTQEKKQLRQSWQQERQEIITQLTASMEKTWNKRTLELTTTLQQERQKLDGKWNKERTKVVTKTTEEIQKIWDQQTQKIAELVNKDRKKLTKDWQKERSELVASAVSNVQKLWQQERAREKEQRLMTTGAPVFANNNHEAQKLKELWEEKPQYLLKKTPFYRKYRKLLVAKKQPLTTELASLLLLLKKQEEKSEKEQELFLQVLQEYYKKQRKNKKKR